MSNVINQITEKQFKDWIIALKSGNYEQGTGKLCDINMRYCCLGVLGQVLNLPKIEAHNRDRYRFFINNLEFGGIFVSNELVYFLPENLQKNLAELNDDGGTSFKDIAKYLEDHVSFDPLGNLRYK